ncbi:carbohydrate ABC transporter permease [Actinobacteria bacterium YIM 96077]|uniref:Carbohydrate ABC transporter permease n=1 Tax=Phytoactinopolyspora halophila TaxID=1981511 RepID=A0A329QBS4_9ACTN|nr:carbohydrate ABC transporter permease [Phytoactinopolyspora halophila]AYY14635.1 carbohydrate ABC transporter permease [Actinobacteria bacterium YIM 96077]RAW09199.1 carbohydrate ABC transporter permease [Phytoactinopolyspora halophila]
MSAVQSTPETREGWDGTETVSPSARARKRLSSPGASTAAIIIAVLWTLPTFGLFLSSFRPEEEIKNNGWWNWFTDPQLTLENYREVLFGSRTELSTYVINSVAITVPSVVIPVSLALLAAYAFAWMKFPFRDTLFVAVFALQIVPIQIALVPLLQIFVDVGLNGTFWPLWIAHSTFALPLAVYLLHNFMRDIPVELIEAARVDGAGHVKIFGTIMLPLIMPAIAAFCVFQFLWVWNDLLVALTFAGSTSDVAPLTARIAELVGTRGTEWHLLSAGAFVAMIIPVLVFLTLQRFFVRGLLAGSVKG